MSRTTRWCPTPEQLMVLEELYRGGLRTPKAPLIQKITAHLSSYGKIEGKNVFYWFQNHKARDRQKLRRKMSMQLLQQQQLLFQHQQVPLQNFFTPTFHQLLPSHAAMIHQGMVEDVPSARTSNMLKLELSENNEFQSSLTVPKTYGTSDYWMMTSTVDNNNMLIPINILSSCSDNIIAPLKTLDLFPITSSGGTLRDQN